MQELQPFSQQYSNINLIEASAGTGKTYNIIALYFRYLIEQNLSVRHILVVTFTRAATAELKNRLLSTIRQASRLLRTGQESNDPFLKDLFTWLEKSGHSPKKTIVKLKKAERTFNDVQIFTIHGFCNKILQTEAFGTGTLYDAELVENDRELAQEAVDDYWRSLNKFNKKDKILSQYILGKYENPDKLLNEIYPYLGKTYLQTTADNLSLGSLKEALRNYKLAFEKLKDLWKTKKETIREGMGSNRLRAYKSNRESRMSNIEEWINTTFPPNNGTDKLKFFRYSTMEKKLNNDAREKKLLPPQHPFFKQADVFVNQEQKIEELKGAYLQPLLQKIRAALWTKKESLEVFSYNDVLQQFWNVLNNEADGSVFAQKLRNLYPVTLVDEFQDTDPIQYKIFNKIYANQESGAQLFMVGDPKQAIYNFRGADIFVYLNAREDAAEKSQFKLSYNFRSVPPLLRGINYLFQRFNAPFILNDIPYQAMKPGKETDEYKKLTIDDNAIAPLQFWNLHSNEYKNRNKDRLCGIIEKQVIDEIEKLIKLGQTGRAKIGDESLKAGDISILVNEHKQGASIQQKLLKRGIKCLRISKESVFLSDEAFELELLMRAIIEPGKEEAIAAAMVTRLLGKSGEQLMRLKKNKTAWVQYINQFTDWKTEWKTHEFAYVFRLIMQQKKIAARLLNRYDGERRITNLYHLSELLQQHENEFQTGPRGLIKWLAGCRRENNSDQKSFQLRHTTDEDQVNISTLHSSKGLEYPVVFCPYLWQGAEVKNTSKPFIFHKKGTDNAAAFLDVGGESQARRNHLFQKYREELAEHMRLAYVGMTRARQCCYIPWIEHKTSAISPLGILLKGERQAIKYLRKKLKLEVDDKIDFISTGEAFKEVKAYASKFIATEIPKAPIVVEAETESEDLPVLRVKKWNDSKRISAPEQVASFSYLSHQAVSHPQEPDYDQWIFQPAGKHRASAKPNMMNFPRGLKPGRCIHAIFEVIDFKSPPQSALNKKLILHEMKRHGINKKWEKPLQNCIAAILNRPLIKNNSDSKLSHLTADKELREMEFYFSVSAAKTADLMKIIRGKTTDLTVQTNAGFMKGYIDLIFLVDGRYYILDYKSNFLGEQPEDYNSDSLQKAIDIHFYDLQYHIYSVALHRFLKHRKPDYDYKKHFGGAIYLFIRAIERDTENGNGLFFDRPSFDVIKQMDNYLSNRGIL